MSKIIKVGKGVTSVRKGGNPETELEHFYTCNSCGQAFDMRDLGQVCHHEEPGHKPLDLDA